MYKNTNTLAKAVRLATLAAVAAPASVMAGGFSLNEQSASTMGYANAGSAAYAADASTVIFNPAGMSKLSGTNLSFGASVLDIDAEAKGDTIEATNQLGQPVSGSDGGDIADPAVLPSVFFTHEVSDSVDVGFALHAPYGLAADYDNDFAGRFYADETELSVISFAPSFSINNGQGLSMGVGMNIMYAEGTLSRYMDNSGTNFNAPSGTGPGATSEGYANIEGDDVGVTFQVGFLYDLSQRTQLGLTFQTGTELELEGDAEFTNVSVANTQTGGFAVPLNSKEPVRVPLNIPESISAGFSHKLTDDITLLAGATYAKWSRFEALDIYGRDSSEPLTSQSPGGQPGQLTHIPEEWEDTWQYNVGAIWQATPAWQLKAGYAYDESPVDEILTARIPSADRHWLTLGTQWKDANSGWTVDAAVGTLIFDEDPEVSDRTYVLTSNGSERNPQDPNSGYDAEYDLSAWSASVQVSKAF